MRSIEIGELDDPHGLSCNVSAAGGGLIKIRHVIRLSCAGMRLGVYTDYAYEMVDGEIHAERAFALFIARLSTMVESTTLIGRVRPSATGDARYPLGRGIRMVGLPFYESLSRPVSVLRAMFGSLVAFWRCLDDLDCVWLLGPHPLAIAFALLARVRGRRVVLGVRQDLPTYARTRHPGKPAFLAVAWTLEAGYRLLARFMPVIVVGPDLAHRYRKSGQLLEILVSLIDESEIVEAHGTAGEPRGSTTTVLTVGRIDSEKNPMLLAEVMSSLERSEPGRWRLAVCGEGPLRSALEERLEELGIDGLVDFRGYVSWGEDLRAAYREADLLLHVSLTEGMPQVLLEAFAAGLPCVATDVGGIRAAVGEVAELIPADDAGAAAAALAGLAGDQVRREELSERSLAFIRGHTIKTETAAVAAFIERSPRRP